MGLAEAPEGKARRGVPTPGRLNWEGGGGTGVLRWEGNVRTCILVGDRGWQTLTRTLGLAVCVQLAPEGNAEPSVG